MMPWTPAPKSFSQGAGIVDGPDEHPEPGVQELVGDPPPHEEAADGRVVRERLQVVDNGQVVLGARCGGGSAPPSGAMSRRNASVATEKLWTTVRSCMPSSMTSPRNGCHRARRPLPLSSSSSRPPFVDTSLRSVSSFAAAGRRSPDPPTNPDPAGERVVRPACRRHRSRPFVRSTDWSWITSGVPSPLTCRSTSMQWHPPACCVDRGSVFFGVAREYPGGRGSWSVRYAGDAG